MKKKIIIITSIIVILLLALILFFVIHNKDNKKEEIEEPKTEEKIEIPEEKEENIEVPEEQIEEQIEEQEEQKEVPKKETPKKEETKKETPKKEAPKKETPKKEEPKKENNKTDTNQEKELPPNPPTVTYSCPSSYTLTGNKCTETINATLECPANTTEFRNGETVGCVNLNEGYETESTCPNGYGLIEVINWGKPNTNKCLPLHDKVYTCPSTYTLNGTKCTKTIDATAN